MLHHTIFVVNVIEKKHWTTSLAASKVEVGPQQQAHCY